MDTKLKVQQLDHQRKNPGKEFVASDLKVEVAAGFKIEANESGDLYCCQQD